MGRYSQQPMAASQALGDMVTTMNSKEPDIKRGYKTQHRLSDDEKQLVVERFVAGEGITKLMLAYHSSFSIIRSLLKSVGVYEKRAGHVAVYEPTAEEIEQATARFQASWSRRARRLHRPDPRPYTIPETTATPLDHRSHHGLERKMH